VRVRRTAIGAVLALAVVAAMVVSSAGASPKQEFKMAIFTDIGTLQDRSFNQLANEGRIAAGKQLGIQTRVYQTKKEAERIPNAIAAARAGHNLIFGVGFLNYSAVNAVAPRFPNLQFAGIDEAYALFSKKPKNATGVVFAEHEAGYLVGYLAALQLKSQGGRQVISAVGANNVLRAALPHLSENGVVLIASAIRKPLPMMRSASSRASVARFGM